MTVRRTRGLLAAGVAASVVLAGCSSEVGANSSTTSTTTSSSAVAGSDTSSSEATGSEATGSDATGTSSSGSETSSSSAAPEGPIADTINVGLEQMPGGYNCNNAASNSVYCAYVDNLTQSALVNVQPDGSLLPNEAMGTYEKVSDDPMTVEVTLSDEAVWSDGTPIDFDDVLLQWAAFSGTHPAGNDPDGNPVDAFTAASTNGFELIEKPTGEPGAKSFTWVFTEPYVDWEALFGTLMPAHVVAEQAGLSADGDGAALIEALTNDTADVAAIGAAWSSGFDFEVDVPSLPDVPLLSSGPYMYDNASNGNITLVRNPEYFGEEGKTETFVFKLVDDQEWVQAMANGEIDAFDPSNPSGDTVAQLEANADTIAYDAGESYTFSHVDFNSGPGGKFEDIKVRQAFLKCIPREELVEKYAKPVFPGAQVLNLREFLPAQGNYQEILDQVPSAQLYNEVDLAGAQALLAEAGVATPLEIVFTYAATSSLRADQVQVIKASCDQAGFNITPKPDEDVFTTLALKDTSWDAAVFGWAGSGLVASGQSIYVTDGDQNYGRYSDPIVDEAWSTVVTSTDRETAEQEKVAMEEQLWANPYNATLYANPDVAAYSVNLNGAVKNPTQYGLTWNAATWTKSE